MYITFTAVEANLMVLRGTMSAAFSLAVGTGPTLTTTLPDHWTPFQNYTFDGPPCMTTTLKLPFVFASPFKVPFLILKLKNFIMIFFLLGPGSFLNGPDHRPILFSEPHLWKEDAITQFP